MDAQTEMVRIYLDYLDNPLIFSPYNGTTMATFRFYSCNADDDSPYYIVLFKFRRLERSVVLLLGTTYLLIKGKLIIVFKTIRLINILYCCV